MTFFITLWLRNEDSEDILKKRESVLEESVIKHCGGLQNRPKISSGSNRITVIPLCDSQECNLPKGTIFKITEEIKNRTGRTAKGKVACLLE